jgi:hypothetical protein
MPTSNTLCKPHQFHSRRREEARLHRAPPGRGPPPPCAARPSLSWPSAPSGPARPYHSIPASSPESHDADSMSGRSWGSVGFLHHRGALPSSSSAGGVDVLPPSHRGRGRGGRVHREMQDLISMAHRQEEAPSNAGCKPRRLHGTPLGRGQPPPCAASGSLVFP